MIPPEELFLRILEWVDTSSILNEANDRLLRDARDSTELVFTHFNSSANNVAFSGEGQTIRSVLREVRHAVDA